MASIVERPRKDGTITYQVKWRVGGKRNAKQDTENFGDPESAAAFKGLVDDCGQQWPPGWVRGVGFVEPDAKPDVLDDPPLIEWATRYVDRLTGIEPRTRSDYHRDVRLHLSTIRHTPRNGIATTATIGNATADDIGDWVRAQEQGEPDPLTPDAWLRKPASPKSIANRHGLLWCIFQAAIEAEPPLRSSNPCAKTRLPRIDDEVDTEDMVFLEQDEYARIRTELGDPVARDLADILVGTGMRWGEITALQVRDVSLTGSTPTIRITRAWRRQDDNSFELGPPKTRRSRRTLAVAPVQAEILRRHTTDQGPEAFVFRTAQGKHWRHSNFRYRRWVPAIKAAQAKGLAKTPRIHDLRHTHVSWLIAKNVPLPAIQARLGHESITTTVDRYGHLVRALDGEIVAAIEAAMTGPQPEVGLLRIVQGG